jgi:hypothetical protein
MKYQVWYMKPGFVHGGLFGKMPDVNNIDATHVHLKDVEANGLDGVYHQMQSEIWSPKGEARELIQSKRLQHTSMTIGDVIVDDVGNAYVVAGIGFKAIGRIVETR